MPSLFDPIRLGAIEASSRILMAPPTRGRATRAHLPTPIMIAYYAQRTAAGLIITEATGISWEGLGWPYAPGIWSDEQVEAWIPVVGAVHRVGGRILCQLWHMGRLVHPDFLDGAAPVSASAITAPDAAHTHDGKKPYGAPRALAADEVPRLLAEVTQAVADTIGADRTGVRLSPNEPIQGVDDSDPVPLFGAAAAALGRIGIAFIGLREPGEAGTFGKATPPPVAPAIRQAFGSPLVLNSDYDGVGAQAVLDAGEADAIAFGRGFLANPGLPERIRVAAPLNEDVKATWYSQGREGYIDCATLDAA